MKLEFSEQSCPLELSNPGYLFLLIDVLENSEAGKKQLIS